MKNVVVLGSTGSIGTSTIKVAEDLPDRIRLIALAAGNNLDLLLAQTRKHRPIAVSINDPAKARELEGTLGANCEVYAGAQGLVSKPFEASALLSAVEALLPRAKGRAKRVEDFEEDEDEVREDEARDKRLTQAPMPEVADGREYQSAWEAATSDDEPLFVPREAAAAPMPELEIAGAGLSAVGVAVAAQEPRILLTTESDEIPWL